MDWVSQSPDHPKLCHTFDFMPGKERRIRISENGHMLFYFFNAYSGPGLVDTSSSGFKETFLKML
jgi:hypothetical protein